MAGTARLADTSFLVALLDADDDHHGWAVSVAKANPPPWVACEAVFSEAFFLLGREGSSRLGDLARRGAVRLAFDLGEQLAAVLALMDKYADVPMSLAEACLVRMTEVLPDPMVLTTESDFRVYRRHSRQVIPSRMPG